jgi:hypothetical protein
MMEALTVFNAYRESHEQMETAYKALEKENARQEKTIEALVDLIQSNMDERCAWCFGKNGEHESDCEAMRVLSEVEE